MPQFTAPSAAPTIDQAAIDDLHRRLEQVRWPHRAPGAAVPGFDTDRLRPRLRGRQLRLTRASFGGGGEREDLSGAPGRQLHGQPPPVSR